MRQLHSKLIDEESTLTAPQQICWLQIGLLTLILTRELKMDLILYMRWVRQQLMFCCQWRSIPSYVQCASLYDAAVSVSRLQIRYRDHLQMEQ